MKLKYFSPVFKLLIISSIICTISLSCISAQEKSSDQQWINENTYRVTAAKKIPKHVQNKKTSVKRRYCKNSVILTAQKKIVDSLFKVYNPGGQLGSCHGNRFLYNNLSGHIRGGTIINTIYTKQGCSIIYQVQFPDFRNKVKQYMQTIKCGNM